MPWGRLDDGFWGHWKRLRGLVGLAVDGLFVRTLSRTAHYERDGFIEAEYIEDQLASVGPKWRRQILDAAIERGVLEPLAAGETREVEAPPVGGIRTDPIEVTIGPHRGPGYIVHDFLHYNHARVEIEARREREREKKRKARASRGDSSGSSPEASPRDSHGVSLVTHPIPSLPSPSEGTSYAEVLPFEGSAVGPTSGVVRQGGPE